MVIDRLVLGLIKTNCYIITENNSKDCVVIDAGDRPKQIIEYLDEKGLTPKYFFITHGHFDHFSAIPALRERFGGVPVVIHKDDALNLTDRKRSHYNGKVGLTASDITVDDGAVIELGNLCFKWINTPGHTQGSCVILLGDVMFSGDTLFLEECGRCDFHGGSYPQMLDSLKRIAGMDGDFKVFPGHGEGTTLDYERENNMYMREATGLGPPVYN